MLSAPPPAELARREEGPALPCQESDSACMPLSAARTSASYARRFSSLSSTSLACILADALSVRQSSKLYTVGDTWSMLYKQPSRLANVHLEKACVAR